MGTSEVEFTNVVFKDFAPEYLSLAAGSQVIFGDGTTLELTGHTFVDPAYTLTCKGEVMIDGFGHIIDCANLKTLYFVNCIGQ